MSSFFPNQQSTTQKCSVYCHGGQKKSDTLTNWSHFRFMIVGDYISGESTTDISTEIVQNRIPGKKKWKMPFDQLVFVVRLYIDWAVGT